MQQPEPAPERSGYPWWGWLIGIWCLERVFIQEFQNVLTHWFSRLTTEPDFCRGLCVRARAGVP